MKQALHIFRKDVHYLRVDVSLNMVAAAAFCFMGVRDVRGPGPTAFVLPLLWWFLIGRLIHAEALPGNRHFWLTRPYEWRSLLGAKILFVLAFVNLPLLLADAAILAAAGFSIGGELTGLLWTQVLLIAIFILPTATFAAITNGLAEFLTVTLLLIAGSLLWVLTTPLLRRDFHWMELEWVKAYFLLAQIGAAAACILLWQFARRRTKASRIAVGAAGVAVLVSGALLPWRTAFALQARLSQRNVDLSSIHIGLDSDRKWMARVYAGEQDRVVVELPLKISGLPGSTDLRPDGLTVTLRTRGGEIRIADQPPPESINFDAGVTSLRVAVARDLYENVKAQLLQLRGTLYFTLYGNKHTTPVPLSGVPVRVNGIGFCTAGLRYILCNSAFRPPAEPVSIKILQDSVNGPQATTETFGPIGSYSPFPADFNIDPLCQFFSPRMKTVIEAQVDTSDAVAYSKQDFEIDDVRLNDFPVSSDLATHQ